MMLIRFVLSLCFLLPLAACLQGAVIFDQPLSTEHDRGPFSQSGLQEFADQFELSTGSRVTGVRWYGSYFEADLSASVTNVDFNLRIFQDQNGLPSGDAYAVHALTASVRHTGTSVERRAIYEFTADLPAFLIPAGVSWLSISERSARESSTIPASAGPWRWALSHQDEADTAAAIQPGSAWSVALDRRNVAFALLHDEDRAGALTPEPATAALVVAGLSGILLARRRTAHRS
jgi:hypothetical protein